MILNKLERVLRVLFLRNFVKVMTSISFFVLLFLFSFQKILKNIFIAFFLLMENGNNFIVGFLQPVQSKILHLKITWPWIHDFRFKMFDKWIFKILSFNINFSYFSKGVRFRFSSFKGGQLFSFLVFKKFLKYLKYVIFWRFQHFDYHDNLCCFIMGSIDALFNLKINLNDDQFLSIYGLFFYKNINTRTQDLEPKNMLRNMTRDWKPNTILYIVQILSYI